MSIAIERAVPAQLDSLLAIEQAALALFRGHRAWPHYAAVTMPPALLGEAIERGRVWVARGAASMAPLGFLWLEDRAPDGAAQIVEFDVDPAHGRQGIGAALLEHVCAWADEAGHAAVELGTLAELPWNAPFYARHGFAVVDDPRDPAAARARARDRDNGFPADLRVFMRRRLDGAMAAGWTRWPAPAKLNLFLHITGRRADGYHALQTVFRLLDWGDELRLRPRADGQIVRHGGLPGVAAQDDLVLRAAQALQRQAGITAGAELMLDKRIPMGGGLGGGSSDAATVLVAFNHLWRAGLDEDALATLGRGLGADVPVFVRGRSAWAAGIGDELTALELPRRHYLVLDPREHVPTAALFQAPELTRNAPPVTIPDFVSGEVAGNAFEPVVRSRHPRVAAALDWLGGHGRARLSGSGGCVFLETATREAAHALARACPAALGTAHAVAGVNRSPLLRALARHRARTK